MAAAGWQVPAEPTMRRLACCPQKCPRADSRSVLAGGDRRTSSSATRGVPRYHPVAPNFCVRPAHADALLTERGARLQADASRRPLLQRLLEFAAVFIRYYTAHRCVRFCSVPYTLLAVYRGSFCYPRGVEQPQHVDLAALRSELARRAARLVPQAPVGAVLGHQQARHHARVARLSGAVCGGLPSPLGMPYAEVRVGARLDREQGPLQDSARMAPSRLRFTSAIACPGGGT